ncbi:hypothetical protein HYC85_001148 [Camellia sinensis]|uniref:Uncharacterized protein n=1 Tax=Camellia sinensis TaxID=4442 RepID=A0A7J7I4U6_CAMSI|nr:hypothetical protein HYC85_001148 [Camellia sinensis]
MRLGVIGNVTPLLSFFLHWSWIVDVLGRRLIGKRSFPLSDVLRLPSGVSNSEDCLPSVGCMIRKLSQSYCALAMTTLFASMTYHHEFSERGKIFAKQEVRSIQIGPGGLFFTGDGTGQVKVWNWLAEPTAAV